MKFTKSASVEELQVISRFESLRKILLSEQYADHLKKPLAYWALPTDRRLPLAFLGRTLEDLLQTPFSELSNTPGIGQKKICSFVKLLARAANTDPSELPTEASPCRPGKRGRRRRRRFGRRVQRRLGLGGGVGPVAGKREQARPGRREARPLRPDVAEHDPRDLEHALEAYTQFSLSEIRSMKTHGEKRVRAILEVFHSVHVLVANMGTQDHLVVRIFPRRIDQVEQWIGLALQTPGVPTTQELFENVVSPLLEQVRTDATQQIASLAENRLGISGPITSVRQAARAMGLTRARVYQLLNEINDIMAVRWPNGRHQMYELREKLVAESKSMDSRPTCSSSSPPSSCSIPAVAAAPPARWSTSSARTTKTKRPRSRPTTATWSRPSRSAIAIPDECAGGKELARIDICATVAYFSLMTGRNIVFVPGGDFRSCFKTGQAGKMPALPARF